MNKITADTAAKWWTDHLREGALLDHGGRSPEEIMGLGLAKILQDRESKKWTPEKIDAFEKELSMRLRMDDNSHIFINVDYHPSIIFQSTAASIGIELGMTDLPWKTSMWITNGEKIEVSLGYGGQIAELRLAND